MRSSTLTMFTNRRGVATEIKKRNVQRKSKDHINRAKDIAHLMSAGMTGSDFRGCGEEYAPDTEDTPGSASEEARLSTTSTLSYTCSAYCSQAVHV